MRKIIAGMFASLDGVVEAPETWQAPYFDDEMGKELGRSMAEADCLLLGRRTYELFAGHWPDQAGPAATFMNDTPKLVVSTTLTSLHWQNSTLISRDVAGEVASAKQREGRNILISGSPTLVRSLLRIGLLDELRLMVCPVIVGTGKRLFEGWDVQMPLVLRDAVTFESGVLSLTYVPIPTPVIEQVPAATGRVVGSA